MCMYSSLSVFQLYRDTGPYKEIVDNISVIVGFWLHEMCVFVEMG